MLYCCLVWASLIIFLLCFSLSARSLYLWRKAALRAVRPSSKNTHKTFTPTITISWWADILTRFFVFLDILSFLNVVWEKDFCLCWEVELLQSRLRFKELKSLWTLTSLTSSASSAQSYKIIILLLVFSFSLSTFGALLFNFHNSSIWFQMLSQQHLTFTQE